MMLSDTHRSGWIVTWLSCGMLLAASLHADEPVGQGRSGNSKQNVPGNAATVSTADRESKLEVAIRTVGKVSENAQGAAAARQAREFLSQADASTLPRLLEAMDTSNVLAANWYRTA